MVRVKWFISAVTFSRNWSGQQINLTGEQNEYQRKQFVS